MNSRLRRFFLWCYPFDAERDEIHPGRWRALAIWIVVFTALTAYALYNQREQAHSTDNRFCDVTSSFLSSEADLRDQLNKNDLQTIGLRQNVQEAARNATYVFRLAPQSPVFQPIFRDSIIHFLQAIDDLNAGQVLSGQAALARADAFVDNLRRLRRRLRCSS